jgi:hypothetical protein
LEFALLNWNAIYERAGVALEIAQNKQTVAPRNFAVMWRNRGVFEMDGVVGGAA